MSVLLCMPTVSPNLFPNYSSRQKQNINENSRLLRKKNISSTTTHVFRCTNQISKSHVHFSGKNSSSTGIIEKDPVLFTNNDKQSSKMQQQDGLGIIDFFSGKKLLITGATGFLAKVLVEKILRSMPEVDKIFLLIKAKDKEAAMQRIMNEIINTELFKCLREKHGTSFERFILSKLVPVVGNMCETDMGIEDSVANRITREVDVIINSAANTTFDERLDVALDVNTRGAARIVRFAKKCENLKLYVHVSTAYVSRQREGKIMEESFGKGHYVTNNADDIFEAPYDKHIPDLDVEAEIKLASDMKKFYKQDKKGQKLKEWGILRAQKYGWPNTYAFTKAMGEMVVEDTKGDLPVITIRPTVIESTLEGPFPGWIEGNRMVDPIVLSYGKGKLPGLLMNPTTIVDVVPVDMVVNSTLAAIAKHGREKSKPNDANCHVYQTASSVANPLTFQDLFAMAYQHFSLNPCFDMMGNPIYISEYKFFNSIEDMLSKMENNNSTVGNEKMSPRHEQIRRKSMEHFKHMANIYEPYTFFNGRFDNSRVEKLLKCLSEEERKEFGFDVSSIDWNDYIKGVHIHGIRKHVMKERTLK